MFELHRIKITEQRNLQRLERAKIEAGYPPNTLSQDSYHSEENLLFQPEPPSAPAPALPPRNNPIAVISDAKPPPLYQRFATNLDVTSTQSCDNLCDKKK